MTSIPKTVVFDLGKVLLDFDYTIAARKLIRNGKVKLTELAQFFAAPADILMRYETGLLTTSEFYAQICSLTGYSGGLDEFSGCFADIFTPIQEMLDAHASIRAQGIPTYIFSNTNELAVEHIRSRYPFFADFDGHILSYEHGAMKPDSALYEVVERVSGFKRGDILYLDDREENIATGRHRGWRVILQQDVPKTLLQLKEHGLLR